MSTPSPLWFIAPWAIICAAAAGGWVAAYRHERAMARALDDLTEEEPVDCYDLDRRTLALLLAGHHRVESPPDRCSCGYQGRWGELFSAHLVDVAWGTGWRPTVGRRNTIKGCPECSEPLGFGHTLACRTGAR